MNLDIRIGDCLANLRTLPEESVQMCVTSPPYYGLRDYKMNGQLGMEKTPDVYVKTMVTVFEEVRRIVKKDGTFWLNIGDSYAGSRKGPSNSLQHEASDMYSKSKRLPRGAGRWGGGNATAPECKFKDLIGIPWLLAFALRSAGWYLRQDIIWAKPNPMPESVTDRCTKSHEYLFLFSKSPKYYYDNEAIKEPVAHATRIRLAQNVAEQNGSNRANGGTKTNGPMKACGKSSWKSSNFTNGKSAEYGLGRCQSEESRIASKGVLETEWETRNRRSVWTIATTPFKGAHFAVFPPKLVLPCILAGSRIGDTVLDPFLGSGTTAMVALQNGRKAIGVELNPEYAAMAYRRCGLPDPSEAWLE